MKHDGHVADDATRDDKPQRKPWVAPAVRELPKLTDLTLMTGSAIGGTGNSGGGGSAVF